jgi:AhpD family alkylhydroperoxidase
MSEFEIHTVESAPEASRPLLEGLRGQAGFVPNLAATMATSPVLLEAFLSLRSIAARGSLDPVSREAVAVAVAREVQCTYCVAAHSTFALMQGASPAVVEALRAGRAPSDARLAALARFARAMVRQQDVQGSITQLAALGISGAALLDTVAVIAVPMLAGLAHQLTHARLDPPFEPQAWNAA